MRNRERERLALGQSSISVQLQSLCGDGSFCTVEAGGGIRGNDGSAHLTLSGPNINIRKTKAEVRAYTSVLSHPHIACAVGYPVCSP